MNRPCECELALETSSESEYSSVGVIFFMAVGFRKACLTQENLQRRGLWICSMCLL